MMFQKVINTVGSNGAESGGWQLEWVVTAVVTRALIEELTCEQKRERSKE